MAGELDTALPGDAASTTLFGGDDPSASASRRSDELELARGTVLGRYIVLARLGAGGMGVVYAAYDPELDRKVALKLLRTQGGSSKRSARLLREAQALAKLSHPNVVAIHDVGTMDERVWLAMEFVEGVTFAEWMRAEPRAWREVLAVLQPVADGLSAAHAAGLVHRDIKPDNVMIETAIGRVRVMDFGLARSAASLDDTGVATQDPHNREPITDVAAREASARAGTPGYMAPEQWLNLPCDARSDQFSFCVMLWESLFSRRAFGGETLAELAANVLRGNLKAPPRGATAPTWLRRVVRRGLERDPNRRHASMAALLDALARGRSGARSRRTVAALVVVAALVGGGFGVRALRRTQGEAACEAEAAAIEQVWNPDARADLRAALVGTQVPYAAVTADKVMPWLDHQADAWRRAAREACVAGEVELSWDADLLERARWCLDERRSQLAAVIEQLSQGGTAAVERGVSAAAALPSVESCRDPTLLARRPALPVERRDEVQAIAGELSRARAMGAAGAYADALALNLQIVEKAQALGWAPLLAEARGSLGRAHERTGAFEDAERELAECYFGAAAAGATELAMQAAENLAFVVGVRLARHADGLQWSRHAELFLADVPDATGVREASHLATLANIHYDSGAYGEAQQLHERALEIREAMLGTDHPETAGSLNNLANVLFVTGQLSAAAEMYERACATMEHSFGPQHPSVATCQVNLAAIAEATGATARAIDLYERALASMEATLGPDHPSVAAPLVNLAATLERTGEHERARALYERALVIWETSLGPDHPMVAHALIGLAAVALARQDAKDALPLAERALVLRAREAGRAEEIAEARFLLARALWEGGGDRARAIALAEAAREFYRGGTAARDGGLARVEAWLAAH